MFSKNDMYTALAYMFNSNFRLDDEARAGEYEYIIEGLMRNSQVALSAVKCCHFKKLRN